MIKLIAYTDTGYAEHAVKPTIFPDKTSQVWKLPENMLGSKHYKIIWNFEEERELLDVLSLQMLLGQRTTDGYPMVDLHMPYLPYARQDKKIANDATFNLKVLFKCLNSAGFNKLSAVDVHNPDVTRDQYLRFENISISPTLHKIVETVKPHFIVFPDKGAQYRYGGYLQGYPIIYCEKVRDQLTGEIKSIEPKITGYKELQHGDRLLIVDDICDGGGTFVGVAKALREIQPHVKITLFVTHGIFSKGKNLQGIDEVLTTNSLPKNVGGYEV